MPDAIPSPKPCSICGDVKPLEDFHRSKAMRDGHVNQCKLCVCARSNQWYHARKTDPEFASERRKRGKVSFKKWREANLERERVRVLEYHSQNKASASAQYRAWRIANAQRVNEKNHQRRARLLNAFVAPVDRDEIWERDGGTCQICGDPIDVTQPWPHPLSRTLDHVIPLVLGGTHEPANVQLAHARCNSQKGDRLPGSAGTVPRSSAS
ncbi:MAG: hypothetical protein JWO67_7182 [Streptosporangiaceae bacterium]|nr:hypothetical protein [Streptosporangiaceae bacterium]